MDRALSSANNRVPSTETYLSYNTNITEGNPFYEDYQKALFSGGGGANDLNEPEIYSDNTYRSFKEVLNINKTFLDSSNSDLENFNVSKELFKVEACKD